MQLTVLHSISQQIWKTQQWPQDWKMSVFQRKAISNNIWSVFIPIPKKGNTKGYSNYCTIALISHASKVILKILQARLQQYVNWELSDAQDGFRKKKAGEPEIKLPTSNHRKSKRCSATCLWFQNFYVSSLLPLLSHSSFSKLSETLSPGLQSSFYPI